MGYRTGKLFSRQVKTMKNCLRDVLKNGSRGLSGAFDFRTNDERIASMKLVFTPRPGGLIGLCKVLRFVFGIFAAAGLAQLYGFSQALKNDQKVSLLSVIMLLAVIAVAGLIAGYASHFVTNGCGICASNGDGKSVAVKGLVGVPQEEFLDVMFDLRKMLGTDERVRGMFLEERGKVIDLLSTLRINDNLRSWVANQIASARTLYLLGYKRDGVVDALTKKRIEQEVMSKAFAENSVDHFEKHFNSVASVGSVGETEWCLAGAPNYMLTTDRLLTFDGKKSVKSSALLSEATEITLIM
jgi:hypothetical protein